MKFPNKLRNATRAIVHDLANRLGIAPVNLQSIAEWAATQKDGRDLFSASCLALENRTRTIKQLPYDGDPFAQPLEPVADARFGLVYDMLNAFELAEPEAFWTPAAAPVESPKAPIDWTQGLTPEESEELFGSPPAKQVIVTGDRPTISWNDDQSKAIKKVLKWYKQPLSSKSQIFRLFGFGGTGKTSMVQEIAWSIRNGDGVPRGEVMFAAYTGQAAAVMMSKGCSPASTIHSLIYKPIVDAVTGKVTGFSINKDSPLALAKLLIVDEVSMVNEEMGADLLSFGVPILVVGDPGQIEPIRGEGFFMSAEPDVLLTRVERVAQENPLIYLATLVRNGQRIQPGSYGSTNVYRDKAIPDDLVLEADQLLCGMNRTRHTLNRRYRILAGFDAYDSQYPVKGDRLMCLRNNKDTGVLNGTQWHCGEPEIRYIERLTDFRDPSKGTELTRIEGLHFRARACDLFDASGSPRIINTICSAHHFDENLPEPPWKDIAGTDEFTFAYAATVHKFQGSQAPHIVIADESFVFREQEWKHRYTSLTRASERADIFM